MGQWKADKTIWSQRHNGVSSMKKIAVILHTDESAYDYAAGRVRDWGWTATQLAEYNAGGPNPRSTDRGSYHIGVDNNRETVRMVNDRGAPWAVGNVGNSNCVHVCMAGTTAYWTREQWLARPALLDETAKVVAHELTFHGLANRRVTATMLRSSQSGFGGHGDCTVAWGGSSHWDPGGYTDRYRGQITNAGGFPWDHMAALITKHMAGDTGGLTVDQADRVIRHMEDFIRGYLGPLIEDTKDNRFQLTGSRDSVPGDVHASYPGHEQLGQNAQGHNLTPVDAIAALRRDLETLRKEMKR